MATHDTTRLERRRQVRVRLRPNLEITPQRQGERTFYVLKDPVSLAYFRLDEGQRFAAGLMDGRHTLDEIRAAYEERFRPERLSPEELEAFAARLVDAGLAVSDAPRVGQRVWELTRRHRRRAVLTALINFLWIKVPLLDPTPLLDRLVPRLRFLFGRTAALCGLAFVLTAGALVTVRWHDFTTRLPDNRTFFTAANLLALWLAVGLVKAVHELAHAVCCRALGAEVREMGVMFLVLSPSLYCETSDSWVLPEKRRRMAVAAAGIGAELLLAAAASFLWWLSDPGTVTHHLCLGLMVVCTVNTLAWNANPLLRYDGYYVLSDCLEVPNLAEVSARYTRALLLRLAGVSVPPEPLPPGVRPTVFVAYALASYFYRLFAAGVVVYFLCTFLAPYKLAALGVALGLAAAGVLVVWPLWRLVRSLGVGGRWPGVRPARAWVVTGLLGVALVAFFTVPFRVNAVGQAVLEADPDRQRRVTVPEPGGFLREVLVRDGQAVRAGQVLAVLDDPKTEAALRVNEVDQALRCRQAAEQTARLLEDRKDDPPADGLADADAELEALTREHALLLEKRDRLTLRAPCDGIILGLVGPETRGKWLEAGCELCRVADPKAIRAVVLLGPSDRKLIARGDRAWVRVHGLGYGRWRGVVSAVAQTDTGTVPPQLSARVGGEVPTETDPATHADRPRTPHYAVAVRLDESDPAIHPGVLGRVKIEGPPRTCWWRVRRFLAETFSWGL